MFSGKHPNQFQFSSGKQGQEWGIKDLEESQARKRMCSKKASFQRNAKKLFLKNLRQDAPSDFDSELEELAQGDCEENGENLEVKVSRIVGRLFRALQIYQKKCQETIECQQIKILDYQCLPHQIGLHYLYETVQSHQQNSQPLQKFPIINTIVRKLFKYISSKYQPELFFCIASIIQEMQMKTERVENYGGSSVGCSSNSYSSWNQRWNSNLNSIYDENAFRIQEQIQGESQEIKERAIEGIVGRCSSNQLFYINYSSQIRLHFGKLIKNLAWILLKQLKYSQPSLISSANLMLDSASFLHKYPEYFISFQESTLNLPGNQAEEEDYFCNL